MTLVANSDLQLALDAAGKAGEVLLGFWEDRSSLSVSTKRAGDFLSDADVASEESIRATLLGARPDDGWLAEESGESPQSPRRWIVDPLDGTTNFVRGIPHWAVSIALEVGGVLSVGVVHDPVKGETFSATLGGGAQLNGETIRVVDSRTLDSAVFGTGLPFGEMEHIDDHSADLVRILPRCAGIRRMGAASLDLAYVAAGRLDGFWERRLQPWDIAAGLVLLREANATVEGWQHDEKPEDSGTVIAAPPGLFPAFAGLLRSQPTGSA